MPHQDPALALRVSGAATAAVPGIATEQTNRALQQLEQRRQAGVAERQGQQRIAQAQTGLEQRQQVIDVDTQMQRANRFGRLIDFVLQGDEASRPERFMRARAAAESMGADVSQLPQEFTPDIIPQLQSLRAEFGAFDPVDQTRTFAPTTIEDPDNPGQLIRILPTVGRGGEVSFQMLGRAAGLTAEEEAALEVTTAGGVARARGEATQAVGVITEGFERIQSINGNIRTIRRAISALDRGAGTGPAEQFFPSIRAASVELDQIQRELGLDVIGSVTFGALSQGELDLALATALPTGLQEEELREFLTQKESAQEKLRDYFEQQIEFLDTPGNTLAGFVAQQREQRRGVLERLPEGTIDNGDGTFTLPNGEIVEPE